MTPDKVLCDIYKSAKEEEMYLYVNKQEALTRVPEALLERFGKPVHVMTMLLQAQKKLARVDVERVLEQLQAEGFYLQLPPPKDDYMQRIHQNNCKM